MSNSENPAPIECKRCKRTAPPAFNVPYGGALGDEIRTNTCDRCWQEWMGMEVMVINELRLNFMDPDSLEVLTQHLRQYLVLDADGEKPTDGILAGPPEPV